MSLIRYAYLLLQQEIDATRERLTHLLPSHTDNLAHKLIKLGAGPVLTIAGPSLDIDKDIK